MALSVQTKIRQYNGILPFDFLMVKKLKKSTFTITYVLSN